MGLLGKYVGYRVLTGGGRDGGGGDAGIGLVLIFGILAVFIAVMLALQWLFSAITGAIYSTVRPALLVAPHVTTAVLGAGLATVFGKTIVAYPSDAATAILRSTDESSSYYVAAAVAVVTVTSGLLTIVMAASYLEQNPFVNVLWAVLMLYGLYKFGQVLWRTHRLALHAPRGLGYSVALLTPLFTGVLIDVFHVPTAYPPLWYAVWLPGFLVIAAAVIVKYRVESRVLPSRAGPSHSSPTKPVQSDG